MPHVQTISTVMWMVTAVFLFNVTIGRQPALIRQDVDSIPTVPTIPTLFQEVSTPASLFFISRRRGEEEALAAELLNAVDADRANGKNDHMESRVAGGILEKLSK